MRKILPMAAPAIRCYANYAHIFSILGAQAENYYPWLYNHYVQLCVPDDYRTFPVDYMVEGMYTNTPNLFSSRIEREVAVNIRKGIINYIRFAIDNGYYIFMMLEVNQIAAYKDSNMRFHEPLLYGYDDEKDEIYFMDTYKNGIYSKGTASYTEIVNATGNELNWNKFRLTNLGLDVLCMKYKDLNEHFIFNKYTYIKLLRHYVNKIDTYQSFWEVPGVTRGKTISYICGIGIYVLMRKHLQYVEKDAGELIDIRGFYVILEHKKLLQKALLYLLGEQWEEKFPLEARLMQAEIKNATVCLNLCLKYNITKNNSTVEEIISRASVMEEDEKILFPNLIKIIESIPF